MLKTNKQPSRTTKNTLKKTSAQNRPKPCSKGHNKTVNHNKNNSSRVLTESPFHLHFASTTELLYSPFQKSCYLPPHLSSAQVQRNVFRAECSNWSVRPSSARKLDYDQLYAANEHRYQNAAIDKERGQSLRVGRRWSQTKSKIKYLLEEDKATWKYFNDSKKAPKREPHPDDDLSEQSSSEDSHS